MTGRRNGIGPANALFPMRLVTWNCKGAFRRKIDFLGSLHADVLIVPESERLLSVSVPLDSKPVQTFRWFGEKPTKGLAVLSFGRLEFKLHPCYEPRFRWVVPLVFNDPVPWVLFAVWTLPVPETQSYVQPLIEAFDHYRPLIGQIPVVWAGDFNSSFRFDRPSRRFRFRDFVDRMSNDGIHSLYHLHRRCEHGEEPEKTFFLHHHRERGHHIDYVFASSALYEHGIDCSVGEFDEWSGRSDHVPLTCEFRAGAK